MKKINYKIKLVLLIVIFLAFAGAMFTFGYGILEARNQARLDIVVEKGLELEILQREQRNFEQGKRDLISLEEKAYPPQDLFSKDTRVVTEIKALEILAQRYNLDFDLTVTGTAAEASKATGVSGELLQIPYLVSIEGPYNNILKYIEAAEHTTFINQTQSISLRALDNGMTKADIISKFYLKP
ncbi:MAG TPA: hypothetical protein PKD79_01120 [Candidatus Doudnabacteria bacterium]|nr:hypothetical protein [Candidatus Doudnabacteria bacterium]